MLFECGRCTTTYESEEARDKCMESCQLAARTSGRQQLVRPGMTRQHLLGPPAKRNFVCPWCPAKFAIEQHLQRHVNAHGLQSAKLFEQMLSWIEDVEPNLAGASITVNI